MLFVSEKFSKSAHKLFSRSSWTRRRLAGDHTSPGRGPGDTGGEALETCARRTWPPERRSEPLFALVHWTRDAFDRPPATNNISVRLNLGSNVLLKQVILLKTRVLFTVSRAADRVSISADVPPARAPAGDQRASDGGCNPDNVLRSRGQRIKGCLFGRIKPFLKLYASL